MRRVIRSLGATALALLATSSGCRPAPTGPTCEEVAAHAVELFPPEPEEDAAGQRQLVARNCEQREWSVEGRRCLLAASDPVGYGRCVGAERERRGEDMGGPSCEEVLAASERRVPLATPADRDTAMAFCLGRSRVYKACVLEIPPEAAEAEFAEAYAACRALDPA